MRKDLLPKHLQNLIIRGFEDETPEQKAAREAKEAEDAKDDDDDDEGEEDDKDKGKAENNDALKSALQKERTERKKLARELKAATKFREEHESKDKSDTDKAKDDASKAESKAQKLAGKLNKVAVDNAIIQACTKLKFRDIDDALQMVDRELIEIDQDDDDPSDITVDHDTVKSALEKLAKAKPHLIIAEGQEDKSGSKFNGSKKSTQEVDDEALKAKYPALKRSSHTS